MSVCYALYILRPTAVLVVVEMYEMSEGSLFGLRGSLPNKGGLKKGIMF